MKDIKIDNEEDLLVAMYEYSENGEVKMYEFMTDYPMDGNLVKTFFESLAGQGYIVLTSMDYALVTPKGIEKAKELEHPSLFVISKKPVNLIRDIVIGLIVAVIGGFVLWKLGWN